MNALQISEKEWGEEREKYFHEQNVLKEMIKEFIKEIVLKQPENIEQFASEHFKQFSKEYKGVMIDRQNFKTESNAQK